MGAEKVKFLTFLYRKHYKHTDKLVDSITGCLRSNLSECLKHRLPYNLWL